MTDPIIKPAREPAFRCPRCGATAHFYGSWSSSRYERQLDAFRRKHADCKTPGSVVIDALRGES